MLPRKNLIPLKKEFPRLRQEGKMYNSDSFGLIVSYLATSNQQLATSPQIAFIVSKKISPKSVTRHEVKRKLSDAIHPLLPRLSKNLELVFLAKQKATEVSREELQKEVEDLLQRIKLL